MNIEICFILVCHLVIKLSSFILNTQYSKVVISLNTIVKSLTLSELFLILLGIFNRNLSQINIDFENETF